MAHNFVHIEISANSHAEAIHFYSELFGWKTTSMPEFDYTTFEAAPGPGGGFVNISNPQPNSFYKPGMVVPYVSTDDLDASLAKALSLGAKTLMPKTEIPGTGWIAVFSDLAGNPIGLLQGTEQH